MNTQEEEIKPRILIFSLTYLPFIGGAEIAVKEITSRFANEFEFDLITARLDRKLSSEEMLGNLRVYRVGKGKLSKYLFPWLALKKAKELHQKNSYQIVWGIMAFWAGWAALKFKEKFPRVKYLLTLQSGDSDSFIKRRTWFWRWRYKQIYQKADRIQVISSWLAKRARKYGYQGKIDLVPNGVNLSINKKQLTTNKIRRLRNNLKIRDKEKIVLTVSRLVKKNNIEDLIKAYKLLVTSHKLQAVLLIIGSGPLKSKLQNLVKKLMLQDKVVFINNVPYEDLPGYYALADVFVRPSLSEGFGNVFIEAMAAGVPIIATPVGGILDFLKEGETGWFCKVKNPQSIKEKVQYVLDDKNKEEVNRVVANARKMVEEEYDWDKITEKMREIFTTLSRPHDRGIDIPW